MGKWLLDRLYLHKDQPTSRFAFQGSINWIRGLGILVNSESFSDENLKNHYQTIQRRDINKNADTAVFENILMSLHHLSALEKFSSLENNHYDIVRSAIISWYYGIYYAAKAMIAAEDGADPQTHSDAAKVWQNGIIKRKLAIGPFGANLIDLTNKNIEAEIKRLRGANNYDMSSTPSNEIEAWGCIYSYLKGTTKYTQWRTEEKIKSSKEFKKLNVANFRTKVARELRDEWFKKGSVNLLSQAFRYRGKANYRDSIYLSYGDNREDEIKILVDDLYMIAMKFLRMSAHFSSKRVESGTWNDFVDDISNNSRIAIDCNIIKI